MIQVGVVLAAGRSNRFGTENKLLTPLRGMPLAAHCAATMRKVDLDHRIAVVATLDVGLLFAGFQVEVLDMQNAQQSDSLKLGVQKARALGADRILVTLADMPLIGTDTMDSVLRACTDHTSSAVTDGHRRMPPACFPRSMFADLDRLDGDRGAGPILRKISTENLVVVTPEVLIDVDTPGDLSRL